MDLKSLNGNACLLCNIVISVLYLRSVQCLPLSAPSAAGSDITHTAPDISSEYKYQNNIFKDKSIVENSVLEKQNSRIVHALHHDSALMDNPGTRAAAVKPTTEIIVTVVKRSGRFWEPWELNHNICPPSLCTSSEENRPRGTGGSVFYNGDIILDKESEQQIYGNSIRQRWSRYKRATMRSSRIWKGGVVPFVFADDIFPKAKSVIKKAIKSIQNNTCIRFRRKKLRDEDYIRFISEPGCWSNVGKVGGEQKVSIGSGCERVGTAIHEISHALGFWHEQARPDRDEYVQILEENISPRYLPDFDKANTSLVSSRGYPYDYESVMHYSQKAFTNIGDVTIKIIGIGKKLKMKIGQRDALSTIDIAQLRDMYNCNDKEDDDVTHCPEGWKKNGRSCYKFESRLREQFSGALRHCEKLNSKLLVIDNSREDVYIKRYLKKKFPDVLAWRTAGRLVNGTFKWFMGDKQKPKEMEYKKWKKGQPSSYSSMALVLKKNKNKTTMTWQGVWLGSVSQLPKYAYAFICERKSKRKCIPGGYKDSRDYRGTLDHTLEGITCQKWSSQYPHAHQLLSYPYTGDGKQDQDGLGDHNYCRNPSKKRRSRPWCYTNKKNYQWQYCDISQCSGGSNANDNKRREDNVIADAAAATRDLDTAHNRRGVVNNKGDRVNSRKDKANNRRDTDNKRNQNKKANRKHNNKAGSNKKNEQNRNNVNAPLYNSQNLNEKKPSTGSKRNINNNRDYKPNGKQRHNTRKTEGNKSNEKKKNEKGYKTNKQDKNDETSTRNDRSVAPKADTGRRT